MVTTVVTPLLQWALLITKNESTMMHAGLAWAGGSHHMMANAGVTWKVGNRDSEAAVADRYRKGPYQLCLCNATRNGFR